MPVKINKDHIYVNVLRVVMYTEFYVRDFLCALIILCMRNYLPDSLKVKTFYMIILDRYFEKKSE